MMRIKHIWEYVPVPAKVKLLVDRVTFSRITLFYVSFSVIHCVVQVAFQVEAFGVNAGAARFLQDIITQGNASATGFTVLGQDLRMCSTVPRTLSASSCPVVWDGTPTSNSTTVGSQDHVADPMLSPEPSSVSASSISSVLSLSSLSVSPAMASPATSTVLPEFSSAQPSSFPAIQTSTVVPTLPIAISNQPAASDTSDRDTLATTARVTRTVTVLKAAPTQSASDVDDDEPAKQKRDSNPHVISATTTSGWTQVKVGGLDGQDEVTLSDTCLVTLNWPLSSVDNTKREDIAFVGFSIWVLGMSLVAVLNESPPHIVASFLTHMMATGWAAVQLVSTKQFHSEFSRLTTHGACGINLLPTYWGDRAKAEIPILALNVLALLISTYLSWKLMKSFGWQTFKRIGASLTMSRAYRTVLMLSISIQLSVFFIVVTAALWIDQIYNGDIGRLTTRSVAFRAVTILIIVLSIPWLTLGWTSVRREYKLPMILFLVMSFGYLVGWSAMFFSYTFRWTFVTWRFFSVMASASVLLTFVTLILGICCRLNFGKGLSHYLRGQEQLPDENFVPAMPPYDEEQDIEKVDFPTFNAPVPTFSTAYGSEPQMPPPSYGSGPRVLGPRFFAQSAEPFDRQVQPLSRQGSGSSQSSKLSTSSSSSSFSATGSMMGKRWIIE